MMCGVQHAPPEDPNSFAFDVKERNDREPPFFILLREERQTFARELDHARGVTLRRAVCRQHFVRGHFRQAEKLAKEATLRQQLVLHDLTHAARTRMWFEREIVNREFTPDGIEFVYFARVRSYEALKRAR